ncbi:RecQ family ATP-dependent DNA helicase [Mycobacterium sp. NPDC003323]
MSRRDDLQGVAERVFGWQQLSDEQLDAMAAVLGGRDVLAVMPTGSGKSAIYQVPAVLLDGTTVVISPLIALQRDQLDHLAGTDAPDAVAINSAQGAGETSRSWEAVRRHDADYVFLSPEQLAKEETIARLADLRVALIVVDEAHCISAWGHDFRPDYLRLTDAIERLGHPPVAALTATASPVVRREIVERLRLREPQVIASGFDRPNLRLDVARHSTDADKRAAVLAAVGEVTGPVLLYTATRKDAEQYSEQLSGRGVSAAAYHAGLRARQRDEVHHRFQDDDIDVIAATSAFGMGVDKPNVRAVVHASIPGSLDAYYQQIGRGGRDGEAAQALLFYRPEDLGSARYFTARHPDEDLLRTVHRALCDGPKRLKDLRTELGMRGRALTNAVNLLEQARAVTARRGGFTITDADPADALQRAMDVAAASERVDRSRIEMMRGYAETRDCRRRDLLAYFGETLAQPCGNCDRCADDDPRETAGPPPLPVDTQVEHRQWGPGVVMGGEPDRITVLFDRYGYRTLSADVISATGVLRQT